MYITASAAISPQKILVDQQLVFEETNATGSQQFLAAAYKQAGFDYPKFYKMDNLGKLGWLCTEYLFLKNQEAYQRLKQLPAESVCLLLMNANSSLDTDTRYQASIAQMASPALFVYTLPNIVIGEICIRHGWKGENMFLINEKFDATFLCQQVRLLMQSPGNDACLCGWVDWLNDTYQAKLFVVENNRAAQSVIFTPESIMSIYPE